MSVRRVNDMRNTGNLCCQPPENTALGRMGVYNIGLFFENQPY